MSELFFLPLWLNIIVVFGLELAYLFFESGLPGSIDEFVEKTEEACFEALGGILSVIIWFFTIGAIGGAIAAAVLEFLSFHAISEFINKIFGFAIRTSIIALLMQFVIYLLIWLTLDTCFTPLNNYVRSIKSIYGKYWAGRIFSKLCRAVQIVLSTAFFLIPCSILLFPSVRGMLFIDQELGEKCITELCQNSYIQSGNDVVWVDELSKLYLRAEFMYGSEYGENSNADHVQYYFVKLNYGQQDLSQEMSTFNFGLKEYMHEETARTLCAKVDGKLIGVIGEDQIYCRSILGFCKVTKQYNWKKSVQTDGTYDYSKIYDILQKQENARISLEEAATIVGVMEEKVLIGYSNGCAVFMEKREDGTYFTSLSEEEQKVFGPYDVNTEQTVAFTMDTVYYTNSNQAPMQLSLARGGLHVVDQIPLEDDEKVLTFAFQSDNGTNRTKSVSMLFVTTKKIYYVKDNLYGSRAYTVDEEDKKNVRAYISDENYFVLWNDSIVEQGELSQINLVERE